MPSAPSYRSPHNAPRYAPSTKGRLYGTSRWQRMRLRHLKANPLCVFCLAENIVTPAKVADHIRPHKGDEALFWDEANLQSLCTRHHNSTKQSLEKGGKPRVRIAADGWPA